MNITRGAIIWASAADRNGHVKDRPMVIISIDADPASLLVCCCITTQDKTPRPQSYMRVPWDTKGTSSTGLKEPSFAVASWIVEVERQSVRRVSGELRPAPLSKLLDLIAAFGR